MATAGFARLFVETPARSKVDRIEVVFFNSFELLFFFVFLADPIPNPEERFISSEFCFCFQLVWVLAPIRRNVRVSDHT